LAELVQLKPDVIVTHGQSIIVAAKQAAPGIPIVFALATDPISSGLVASLARPGGNATGLSIQGTDLAGKRLELLREVLPGLRRLGIICHGHNPEMAEAQAAARTLGLDVAALDVRRTEEIVPAFEALRDKADALYVCAEPLINTNRARVSVMALGARLASVH